MFCVLYRAQYRKSVYRRTRYLPPPSRRRGSSGAYFYFFLIVKLIITALVGGSIESVVSDIFRSRVDLRFVSATIVSDRNERLESLEHFEVFTGSMEYISIGNQKGLLYLEIGELSRTRRELDFVF
jgi:hypothetical protein